MATEKNIELIDDSLKPLPIGALNLKPEIVEALKKKNYIVFSNIQGKAIPKLLKHKSVLGLSPTGTGKTFAYALPIINDLDASIPGVKAIILTPTVALLDQIKRSFLEIVDELDFKEDTIKIIKNKSDFNQSKPQVIITTISMYSQIRSHYSLNNVSRIITDEGDMVAFDGFDEYLSSLQKAKEKHIISFFSASLNIQDIKRVKSAFGIDILIDVRDSQITSDSVSHHLVTYRNIEKYDALVSFIKNNPQFVKSIVFSSTKKGLYDAAEKLKANKISFIMLHGDLDKREIKTALNDFKKLNSGILLASDYASRGVDISDVKNIVSIDLPLDLDYYFHRAGRAGRFATFGDSYVLFDQDDDNQAKRVKDLLRRGISFDQFVLTLNSYKKGKEKYQFKNKGQKDQSNAKLQKQIRHAVEQNKSTKVKPNYKKKVSKAVERVKEKHRMKVVRTNIAKSGGNSKDFHID